MRCPLSITNLFLLKTTLEKQVAAYISHECIMSMCQHISCITVTSKSSLTNLRSQVARKAPGKPGKVVKGFCLFQQMAFWVLMYAQVSLKHFKWHVCKLNELTHQIFILLTHVVICHRATWENVQSALDQMCSKINYHWSCPYLLQPSFRYFEGWWSQNL